MIDCDKKSNVYDVCFLKIINSFSLVSQLLFFFLLIISIFCFIINNSTAYI